MACVERVERERCEGLYHADGAYVGECGAEVWSFQSGSGCLCGGESRAGCEGERSGCF
jgi:hypothetical protein